GSLAAFLRNPERNLGRFLRPERLDPANGAVRLLNAGGDTVASGFMRGDVLSLFIEGRGGSYDFHRVPPDSFSDFYPRGRPSVLNVLIGAAMQAGLPVSPSLPVYATMGDSAVADPRKRALTVEHLINMASGLDCDDGAPDPQPPGSEDVLTQQDTNPDWYRMI